MLSRIHPINRCAELGYWVRSGRTGKGIATAAVVQAASIAFQDLGLKRVEMLIAIGNGRSQPVAEKAGAQREGVPRQRLWVGDQIFDAALYSLLPVDLTPSARENLAESY